MSATSAELTLRSVTDTDPSLAVSLRGERLVRVLPLAALGAAGAALVGYLTSRNPTAQPAHVATVGRVVIIDGLLVAGVYAQLDEDRARMGRLLIGAGLFACVWLLNGARDPVPYTVGAASGALAPAVTSYLLLAHPSGRLRSAGEAQLLIGAASIMLATWLAGSLAGAHPVVATPLLRCAAHCPNNLLTLGLAPSATAPLHTVAIAAWLALALGTVAFLSRRYARASRPARRMILPVLLAACASLLLLVAFLLTHRWHLGAERVLAPLYVAVLVAVPVAIFLGLYMERAYLGTALSGFVRRLSSARPEDVEALMAETLEDSSLTVAFRRRQATGYVDSVGTPVDLGRECRTRSVVFVARDGLPVAAVLFDRELEDQRRFVEAAGDAAISFLRERRLAAELEASTRELQGSRRRLIAASMSERERLRRDLHDSAQQRLLAMRMRLGQAQSARAADGGDTDALLSTLQGEVEETLDEIRALAGGLYPAVLSEYGLARALRRAATAAPIAVAVDAEGVARHPRELEGALYFTCTEALQNAAKHAGADAHATVRLWERDGELRMLIIDAGAGFDVADAVGGSGVAGMRDRIEAVGGTFSISSEPGRGTAVAVRVPLAAELAVTPSTKGDRSDGHT